MFLNDAILSTTISAAVQAASVGGQVVKAGVEYLQSLDLQLKNNFEFILFRPPKLSANTSGVVSTGASIAGGAVDLLINKFYIQKIEIPNLQFKSESLNGSKYITGLEYPDTMTLTFLEDNKGTVIRYIKEWQSNIANPDPQNLAEYIFEDDQEYPKRTGMLLFQRLDRKLSAYPRIIFNEMILKGINTFTAGQDEAGNLVLDVDFFVSDVRIPLVF